MTSRQIRQSFLNFFEERGHRILPSAPVVPHADPTLLFTNAGMNQFKDVFLGTGKRDYMRAADTQKCIRVSGKHNDLEEVGYDTYHHTFFEMLGNWSFGDYFKDEAIRWSWELLTKEWKLDATRLHATVFTTDEEAYNIWKTFLPESHIHRFGEKDNFWEMGDTGPCGPCSEIHYDRTPDKSGAKLVNAGVQDVIEIWNNVFIQYNRRADGSLEDLPARHVDTGMGFERITAVLQGKNSNYDTDIFQPIIAFTEDLSGKIYQPEINHPDGIAMRVIADHVRTLTFAIADGAIPGNTGRGYVLRRILRRAARYARKLELTEPMLYKHVDVVCSLMGDVFPEIVTNKTVIQRVIKAEEEQFLQTLDHGRAELHNAWKRINGGESGESTETHVLSGDVAFKLYDTYGFPLDLTDLIAREEYGLHVDHAAFNVLLAEQRQRSRAAHKSHAQHVELAPLHIVTKFTGYNSSETSSEILHVDGSKVVLAETPFYVEMGGQVSDTGTLVVGGSEYVVDDVRKVGDAIIHICETDVDATIGDTAIARIDAPRRGNIQREHSATHLVHEALRRILGRHVQQAGSLVAPNHLRFDFSHFERVPADELQAIEDLVNEKIFQSIDVVTQELPTEKARTIPGVKMFFGDKYGDNVRVVFIDETFSVEFCGGTHVRNTSEIGLFKIIDETSVASGVRRIEAVSGRNVRQFISGLLQQHESNQARQEQLQERVRDLENAMAAQRTGELKKTIPDIVKGASVVDGIRVVSKRVDAGALEQLKDLGDELRHELKVNGIGLLAAVIDGKVQLVCVVTDDLTATKPAGVLIGRIARELGGGGGGKAHMATAGARDVTKLDAVLTRFPEMVFL